MGKAKKGSLEVEWWDVSLHAVHRLRCPVCGRKSIGRVDKSQPLPWCVSCFDCVMAELGLKRMVDLGVVKRAVRMRKKVYMRGKIRKKVL